MLPSVARFALSGEAIGVVGILVAVWWLEGSPTVLAGRVGIVIGALASLPGAVVVLFAADLVRYYRICIATLRNCANSGRSLVIATQVNPESPLKLQGVLRYKRM